MDLVADSLLHYLPPVELQTWVHCLHSHCCQVSLVSSFCVCVHISSLLGKGCIDLASLNTAFSVVLQLCWSASWKKESVWPWRSVATWDSPVLCEGNSDTYCTACDIYKVSFKLGPPCWTLLCVPGSRALPGHLLHTGRSTGQKQRCTFGVLPQLPEVLPHSAVRLCMWVILCSPKC